MVKSGINVLVIDDDPQYRQMLRLNLEAGGYGVMEARDGRAGLELVQTHKPDLVLLDLCLPDAGGVEVCLEVGRLSDVPIMMLAASVDARDVVAGLQAGAEDFVGKSGDFDVLLARMHAVLRRRAVARTSLGRALDLPVLRVGRFMVNHVGQVAYLDGVPLDLSDTEFRLLAELARTPDMVVDAERLILAVWGEERAESNNLLRQNIFRLCQKIERNPSEPVLLLTRHRRGYVLAADAESLRAAQGSAPPVGQ